MTDSPMADRKLLTVVILAYKNTSYAFRQMLDSVTSQTLSGLCVWVLDCNTPSDPYSLSLQEDLSRRDDVRLILNSSAWTGAAARNAVIDLLETPYVCYIDSNDQWYPEKAQLQMMELEKNPAAHACLCNGYCQRAFSHFSGSSLIFSEPDLTPSRWLTSRQFLLASQVMYRTESLRRIGGFDPQLATRLDQDALLRMCGKGTLCIQPAPLFDNNGISFHEEDEEYASLRYLMRKHYDLLLKNRKQRYRMNLLLAQQARRCALWLNMMVHLLVNVIQMPVHSLYCILRSALGSIHSVIHRFWHSCVVQGRALKLRLSIHSRRFGLHQASGAVPRMMGTDMTEEVSLDPARSNRLFAFAGNRKLRNVVLPNHMTSIPCGMFANSKNLERVVIPATVTQISAYAFIGCEKLRYVELEAGSSLTRIEPYAFAGCVSLPSLRLPGHVSFMGAYAFAGCSSLASLLFTYNQQSETVIKPLFPSVLETLPTAVFAGCRSLTMVAFSEGSMLASIGNKAFAGCSSLQQVLFNSRIHTIGNAAFACCTGLEEFILPQIDAIEEIGKRAFYRCISLKYFHLPYALKQIRDGCFEGCEQLRYIKVPKLLSYVGSRAFAQCSSLEQVIFLSPRTKYALNAFDAHTRLECEEGSVIPGKRGV